ncbi:STAS domain-containing protein [Salirhabdus sp. Marseille-P4669]|uniref:STAS domain-containing protein n=1 Tax=Salirhabdus sp. Marseille-P4669 TaxID=2042310 RepID=UPI000C7CAD5C|nr:STAS domain-containing protein [Salirhabdus sp. Marseille-P4669]
MLTLSITDDKNNVKVNLNGDLDIEGTEIVNEELLPKLINFSKVNVSLKEVPFVDSTGMGLLINLVKTLQEKGIVITISDVNKDVLEIFDLLQLPEILGTDVIVS